MKESAVVEMIFRAASFQQDRGVADFNFRRGAFQGKCRKQGKYSQKREPDCLLHVMDSLFLDIVLIVFRKIGISCTVQIRVVAGSDMAVDIKNVYRKQVTE